MPSPEMTAYINLGRSTGLEKRKTALSYCLSLTLMPEASREPKTKELLSAATLACGMEVQACGIPFAGGV